MHYRPARSIVVLLLCLASAANVPVARSQDSPTEPRDEPSNRLSEFWQDAKPLVSQQLFLIDDIEQALAAGDRDRLNDARRRLILNTAAANRFLERRYARPARLCDSAQLQPGYPELLQSEVTLPDNANLTESQRQVYCGLYASTQRLERLLPLLNQRLDQLGGFRQQPATTQRPYSVIPGVEPRQPDERIEAQPPLVGIPVKPPEADAKPRIPPAIAQPQATVVPLQTAQQFIARAIAAFPPSVEFITPAEARAREERFSYTLAPSELLVYLEFLALPYTGIARVLPAEVYRIQTNRLQAAIADRFPFAPLLAKIDEIDDEEFVPRFKIQLDGDRFELVQMGLDYGFIANVGDIPLEKLDPQLDTVNLNSQLQQFFLSYRPPDKLDTLQEDRQRFLTGKLDKFDLPQPVTTDIPVELNHTYLMRSLQFDLPDILTVERNITDRERRLLDILLDMPSRDLLIAFRPVRQREDGSYTVLWRVLNRFPDPQVEDLHKYVNYPDWPQY